MMLEIQVLAWNKYKIVTPVNEIPILPFTQIFVFRRIEQKEAILLVDIAFIIYNHRYFTS